MPSHCASLTSALRVATSLAVLTSALGCAALTRGHVGAQVQNRYPYSMDASLPRPLAKWRVVRRVTTLIVNAAQHEIQRRENNDMDHRTTRADALSIWLPGAPVVR